MDTLSPAERSAVMRRVRSVDTTPEMVIRRLVHSMGFRYRLHRSDLPGKPDLVFPRLNRVIFVHGCFWHGHRCRAGRNRPSSNIEYWLPKLDRNANRDRRNRMKLRHAGWRVLVVWECQIKDKTALHDKLARFLHDGDG
ncbi:MAG: DNA mismatch endonuclease Vsr [Bryobacteraceae bacterium]|nr:DNA mismatch endonuclease Vsr [Bryobacteraceae bacterium]